MARTKTFDEEDAVGRAMVLFWTKGYELTSMADLTKAMQINKGSLYHSFGNKKNLFKRVLRKYDVEHRRTTLAQMKEITDPVVSIDTLFSLLVRQSVEDIGRKGCLLVNTALEIPHHDDDVKAIVESSLNDFEGFFRSRLVLAKQNLAIPADLNIDETAVGLFTLVAGLRVLARGMFSESELTAIRSQAMKLLR